MNTHFFSQNVSARFPDLADKVAIVTGADGIIGSAISNFLGRQQMRLLLTSNADEKTGREFASLLQEQAIQCVWVSANLAEDAEAKKIMEVALEKWGCVDVLVNNAAVKQSSPFLPIEKDTYHTTFESNVRMIYKLSQYVAASLIEQNRLGAIIHLSSVGGLRAHRNLVSYDMSKGAVDALTRAMALELAPHGIRVNAVAPGGIPPGPARPFDRVPLNRTGTGEDIAAAIAFLASNAAAYITGQILYVDGGTTSQLAPPGMYI